MTFFRTETETVRLGHFNFQFSLLYQALECPEQFVTHADGILLEAEILVNLQRLEVRYVIQKERIII